MDLTTKKKLFLLTNQQKQRLLEISRSLFSVWDARALTVLVLRRERRGIAIYDATDEIYSKLYGFNHMP